jgi:hypothetical protein
MRLGGVIPIVTRHYVARAGLEGGGGRRRPYLNSGIGEKRYTMALPWLC